MKKNYPTPVVDTFHAIGIIAGFYAIMAIVALLLS